MSTLRPMPHQLEAIEKLKSGSILCGGVGTGKSFTALLYFCACECRSVKWENEDGSFHLGPMIEPMDLYIITTARKRDTKEWEDECARFDLSAINVTVDSWNNLHKYDSVQGAFFIFDEQRVVGRGAWVKSFIRVTRMNRWILLSATPGDTWMDYIPVFVANGFYKNRTQFLRRHAVFNRFSKYPKVDRWLEITHLETLRRRITVTMDYVKRTTRHFKDILVEYDHEKYDRVSEDRWDIYEDQPIQDISGVCRLMRRVVNEDERRMEALGELLDAHPKAIIFYNYNYERDMLRAIRDWDGFQYAEWNGDKHEPIPAGKKWVYCVQYNAGAEGWNCVTTDTVIFFSQNYSYKMMEQAAGRIDRMNTPYEDLYYYVLKTNSSIDRAISRALRGKRTFNEKNWIRRWEE